MADPRRPDMKEILNRRIKHREIFRPFAPSILADATGEWFEKSHPSPFMTMAYAVRPNKREQIPAPTHVDGTGRLQTVTRDANPRYWRLIKAFEQATGVPMVLNTSFNDNEPIVCSPEEALDCFLRTQMDALVLGDFLIAKNMTGARSRRDPMRVLVLNLYYPPDTSATAKMAAAFVEPLAAKHDVTLICGRPSYDPTERRAWRLWQTERLGAVTVVRVGSTDYPRTQDGAARFELFELRGAERSASTVRAMRRGAGHDRSAIRRDRRRLRGDAETQTIRLQHSRPVSRHGAGRIALWSPVC